MFGMMIDAGSKLFVSTIPKPVYDFKVTVTDLEFLYCNFFTISVFFANPSMDFIHL